VNLVAMLLALVVAVAACGLDGESTTTTTLAPPGTSATTSPVTTSAVTTGPAVNDLAGFARVEVVLAGEPFTVAVADTPVLRAQGLMGVTDLVDVDGMLFVFVTETVIEPVLRSFWMRDTLIPLDIWFFDYDGKLVDMLTMTPCTAEPCERYTPSAPYNYAVETEVGRIGPTTTVELDFYGFED